MENNIFFHGKTHYKSPFSIAMLNYQRQRLSRILWVGRFARSRLVKIPSDW